MYNISVHDYPKSNEWNNKVNSTPSIPGGKNMAIANLRELLLAIKNNHPLDEIPQLEESNSKSTLNDLCVHQLSPMDFVERAEGGKWVLTECAEAWLDSEDDLYLAAFFCAKVKFFAEILFYLDEPKTARDLFNIATNEYDMAWKLPITVNNRLVWLRQFGLIEFHDFSLLYNITELGKAFLKTVTPIMPESIMRGEDDTANESTIEIDEAYLTYYECNKNSARKVGIGYLPGKISDFSDTLVSFLTQISKNNTIEAINEFALSKYNIKNSSTRSALNTISALGFIERKTNTTYIITDLGYSWLEDQNIISLLPLFQLRYLFFLELLQELKETNLSVKELTTIAKISYGFDKENTVEINNRIAVLKQAKLVRNISAEKFVLTHRGELLLDFYADSFGVKKQLTVNIYSDVADSRDIISEIRMASKDSYNPDKFEKIIKDFFALIGFDAEWLGGSGKTDVLLKTIGTPINPFVVTVDAKTTASSAVTDALVDFDTLKEHQKKHKSNYIAVVGRDFNDRLIKRAEEHKVALFDIETLEDLLRIHQKTPQKLSTYRKLFEQCGKVDVSVLNSDIERVESSSILLIQVMERLIEECDDPVTNGQLSVRDLYMSLRNNDKLICPPTIGEIEVALSFLASPIMDCVIKEKDYYSATASLRDLSQKLGYLKCKCD